MCSGLEGILIDWQGGFLGSISNDLMWLLPPFLEAGAGLEGLDIFNAGGERVAELLGGDILHSETITHSYPCDWRTKQPVFLRASKQWFINTDRLKTRALGVLEAVQIQVGSDI